jgi:hypothetical protein
MTQSSETPAVDPQDGVIDQLYGRRNRLQRELTEVRGVASGPVNQRRRLLREIDLVEMEIRDASRARGAVHWPVFR